MATCKDCIHWAVCGRREKSISLDPMKSGYKCPDFKNKADVAEVKRGHWRDDSECGRCSVCDRSISEIYDADSSMAYGILEELIACPFCGAKMDGGAKEDV